jgi:Glycosyltransferase
MRILIVCSYKEQYDNNIAPFVKEQVDEMSSHSGIQINYYLVKGKGCFGYFKNRKSLLCKIRDFQPDIIHAHFGLCGLLANLQRKVPVVTTYHGSDINISSIRFFSKMAIHLSKHNIFVSRKNISKVHVKKYYSHIPCGVDTKCFIETDKEEARDKLGWNKNENYILFAGSFDNAIKNPDLAFEAVKIVDDNIHLVELKGYTRDQVALLMSASDMLLMTSHSEGSPQVIKEAMSVNCPIVSADVGDVGSIVEGVEGCFIVDGNPNLLADAIMEALNFKKRTLGRQKIMKMGLDNKSIVSRLISVYRQIV